MRLTLLDAATVLAQLVRVTKAKAGHALSVPSSPHEPDVWYCTTAGNVLAVGRMEEPAYLLLALDEAERWRLTSWGGAKDQSHDAIARFDGDDAGLLACSTVEELLELARHLRDGEAGRASQPSVTPDEAARAAASTGETEFAPPPSMLIPRPPHDSGCAGPFCERCGDCIVHYGGDACLDGGKHWPPAAAAETGWESEPGRVELHAVATEARAEQEAEPADGEATDAGAVEGDEPEPETPHAPAKRKSQKHGKRGR